MKIPQVSTGPEPDQRSLGSSSAGDNCHEPGMAAASPDLDCLACGACCFQRPGTILISENDLLRWKRASRSDILARLEPGHFGQMAFQMGESGACVHHGTEREPHACRIYDSRGDTCRDFEAGSWQCLEFRRDRGVDPPGPVAPRRR